MVVFALGPFQYRGIMGLVPPEACAMPQFHLVRTIGSSRPNSTPLSRTNAVTSHFKLSQVIEIWVTSSIPYPCPTVDGLQDWVTSPYDCVGHWNRTQDAKHLNMWHYTGANPPTYTSANLPTLANPLTLWANLPTRVLRLLIGVLDLTPIFVNCKKYYIFKVNQQRETTCLYDF